MKKPRTSGLTWLEHSFTAFNGSGYADREYPKAFVESYIMYKKWKNDLKAVQLANDYYAILLELADNLIMHSPGASVIPSVKQHAKFDAFRNGTIVE